MKHFNIKGLIIGALLSINLLASAQQQGDPDLKNKIRAAEIAYLSKQLDLTPEEAEKFWPKYNEYRRETEMLIAERRRNKQQGKELDYEQRMMNIRKRYNQEFRKVLPPPKAGDVFRSEREFRGQLLRTLKDRNDRPRRVNRP